MLKRTALAFLGLWLAIIASATDAGFTSFSAYRNQCLNIAASGDSIAGGFGATTAYSDLLAAAFGSTATIYWDGGIGWNYNTGGTIGGNTLISLAPANIYPLKTSLTCGNGQQPFFLFEGGEADLRYGATGAATYAAFQTFYNGAIAAGQDPQNIFVLALLPATGEDNTQRGIYNAAIVSGGYNVVRLDLDPNIGCDSCNSNSTYYQADGIHPKQAGQAIIANLTCLRINPKNVTCPTY